MRVPTWLRSVVLAAVVALSLVVLFGPPPDGTPTFPYADKAVHVALFALLAAAAMWRFGPVRLVLVLLAAYGVASELVQGLLLPGRQADPLDVVADLAGVAAVWLTARRSTPAAPREPGAPATAAGPP